MIKKCPKCGYERKATDSAPEWQCPSCGVAYAKVSGSTRSSTSNSISKNDAVANTNENSQKRKFTEPVKLLLVGFICLVVGYFAGREHIKYELKQTITTAAEEMQRNLSTVFGGNSNASDDSPVEKKYKPEKKRQAPFSVSLIKKGFMESNYQAGIPSDAVTFTVAFTNKTGRNIRAFDGYLTFTDLLDNKILGASLAINDPVSSDSVMQWSGQLNFNQFIDRHQRLKSAEYENVKIAFEIKKILFDDGSVEEY